MPTVAAEEPVTSSGTAVGTVAHISSERVHGKMIGCADVLFSFGVVLYEIATGTTA